MVLSLTANVAEIFSRWGDIMRFGDLKKGNRFIYQDRIMVKTMRIKDGNDGCFYTCVDIFTGNHYKITDDTEVVRIK